MIGKDRETQLGTVTTNAVSPFSFFPRAGSANAAAPYRPPPPASPNPSEPQEIDQV